MIILKVSSPLGQGEQWASDISRTRTNVLFGCEEDGETSSALRVDPGRRIGGKFWVSVNLRLEGIKVEPD